MAAAPTWTCDTCTYAHEGDEATFLSCAICHEVRAPPRTLPQPPPPDDEGVPQPPPPDDEGVHDDCAAEGDVTVLRVVQGGGGDSRLSANGCATISLFAAHAAVLGDLDEDKFKSIIDHDAPRALTMLAAIGRIVLGEFQQLEVAIEDLYVAGIALRDGILDTKVVITFTPTDNRDEKIDEVEAALSLGPGVVFSEEHFVTVVKAIDGYRVYDSLGINRKATVTKFATPSSFKAWFAHTTRHTLWQASLFNTNNNFDSLAVPARISAIRKSTRKRTRDAC